MHAFVMLLLSPLSWLLLSVAAAIPAWRSHHRRRWLWRACMSVIVLSVLAMTPLLANALLRRIERTPSIDSACFIDPPDTVVVLAGGIDQVPRDATDFEVLGVASRRRLDSGVDYWRAKPGRMLIISGGPAQAGLPAESQLLATYAALFGVPAAAMRLETRSTSTWENAQLLKRMQPAIAHRITLATSALHMPRAQLAFRAAGFEVCPLQSDFRFTPNDLPEALIPRRSALAKSEAVIHELVGLVQYRWRAMRMAPNDYE